MGDEVESVGEGAVGTDEVPELTAEQAVAADTAMLLDLGEAERLAERIAARSGGGDTVVDRWAPEPEPETEELPPAP